MTSQPQIMDVGRFRILTGNSIGKRPVGRPVRRWEDNIRMDLEEIGCNEVDWIELAQDRRNPQLTTNDQYFGHAERQIPDTRLRGKTRYLKLRDRFSRSRPLTDVIGALSGREREKRPVRASPTLEWTIVSERANKLVWSVISRTRDTRATDVEMSEDDDQIMMSKRQSPRTSVTGPSFIAESCSSIESHRDNIAVCTRVGHLGGFQECDVWFRPPRPFLTLYCNLWRTRDGGSWEDTGLVTKYNLGEHSVSWSVASICCKCCENSLDVVVLAER
uniref:Uncharacterized protein n=1 Tax=Timema monikensis TaxID=170555 RepID=A0A7R9EHZ3_9NEOP|nr:unnamed protein product [Timema monikensis]